jgi:cyclic beta-1,2-glucan synthetase
MPEPSIQNLEAVKPEEKGLTEADRAAIRAQAIKTARSCGWLPAKRSGRAREVLRSSFRGLAKLQRRLYRLRTPEPSDDLQWLYDNLRLVRTDVQDLGEAVRILKKLPLVRTPSEEAIPRVIVLARDLLTATHNKLDLEVFSLFIDAVQEVEPLQLWELLGMPAALKLAALERIAEIGPKAIDAFEAQGKAAASLGIGPVIRSLRFVGEVDWNETLEKLSVIHRILLLDPDRVYGHMEFQSRDAYRKGVAYLASHSDCSESEVSHLAVQLAEEA